ncbi:MAG TPA: alpha/beta fold hydrolase [Planctomycetota bacterium]|jgi:pimeloyl-ACP methyl ester carboxylesterase|nr:alpha/beta fold hydrolase [Planctomycetota bacterium]
MGLVLCAAQGHEYIQFHRPFRQLAIQLSEAGCAVLRFDFSGCGDSEGNQEGWSLEGWRDDVAVAIEELKQRVRTTRVGLVGLRLGATLAMQVAETRDDIDAVVVWDPVVDGSAYLSEMRDQYKRMLRYAHVLPANDDGGGDEEVLGFPLPRSLAAELDRVDLLGPQRPPAERVLVIESNEAFAQDALREHLSGLGTQVDHRRFSNPNLWAWTEDFGRVHVPRQVLETIGTWVAETPA